MLDRRHAILAALCFASMGCTARWESDGHVYTRGEMVSLLGGTVSIVEMDGQFLTAGFSPGLLGLAAQAAPSTIAIDNGVEANASAAPSTSISAPPSNFPPGHNK